MASATCAVALLSAGLVACSESAPPPAPPKNTAPPPPPPKPKVSFGTIAQELGADPRITFADDLSVTDEAFARSVVKLANALVKGNAQDLRTLLAPRARGVLESLQNDGRWDESVKSIEGVRVVFAAPPGTQLERGAAVAAMQDRLKEQVEAVREFWAKRGTKEEDVNRIVNEERARLMAELDRYQFEQGKDLFVGRAPNQVLLLAVQRADGATVLGWSANGSGDNWTFDSASTMDVRRARASHWDGVGMSAFSMGTGRKEPLAVRPGPKPAPEPETPADAPGGAPAPAEPPPANPGQPGAPRNPFTPQ